MKLSSRVAAASFWVLAGCSLVVAGDPTPFCESDEGCPASQRCVVSRGTCIDEASACTVRGCGEAQECNASTLECEDRPPPDLVDADADGDTNPIPDAREDRPDTSVPPPRIGTACSAQSDCARVDAGGSAPVAGVCALQSLTGFDVPNFCTVNCCNSEDCPDGYFCEHGPSAGRYCVPFGPGTRDKPSAAKQAGEDCENDAECRTGRCDLALPGMSTQKTCLDTCCRDADCGAGLVCALRLGEGVPLQWICQTPPGTRQPGATCSYPDECRHAACLEGPDLCTVGCCSNAACTQINAQAQCVSASTESGQFRVYICDTTTGNNAGADCAEDSDCKSQLCVGARCASACCTASDCPSGQSCVANGTEPRPHCAD